jgi:hypothetical protein
VAPLRRDKPDWSKFANIVTDNDIWSLAGNGTDDDDAASLLQHSAARARLRQLLARVDKCGESDATFRECKEAALAFVDTTGTLYHFRRQFEQYVVRFQERLAPPLLDKMLDHDICGEGDHISAPRFSLPFLLAPLYAHFYVNTHVRAYPHTYTIMYTPSPTWGLPLF